MKKEIRVVDKAKKIVQITTSDERWYEIDGKFVPSVTWITEFYPKGIGFYKWLANKGWEEAEAIKVAAGDKGSKVHQAIESLLRGEEVPMDAKFINKDTGDEEELTVEEYDCIRSFVDWFNEVKPEIIATEQVVHNRKDGYAGTLDLVCKIKEDYYIIDFKTSQQIWPSFELQLSAYKHAYARLYKDMFFNLAVLQVGYRRNKNGYKFTEVKDKYDLFLFTKGIWENETAGVEPLQKDYPESLKIKVGNKSKNKQP